MAKRKGRPSPRAVRLYHAVSERFGREPADVWVFDPDDCRTPPPPFVTYKQVMVWPAYDDCDVAAFVSLGMSDKRMTGADYRAEAHFAVRAYLPTAARERIARFLAHITVYPFQYDRKLDWWEVMSNPGDIPGFPGCRHLLIRDKLTDDGFDTLDDPRGPVKVLHFVPITAFERHLLLDHGRDALETHWAENGTDVLSDRSDPPGAMG